MTKKWMGTWPANCDLCKVDLAAAKWFTDQQTSGGRWGLLCPTCSRTHGAHIGQVYDSKTLIKLGEVLKWESPHE